MSLRLKSVALVMSFFPSFPPRWSPVMLSACVLVILFYTIRVTCVWEKEERWWWWVVVLQASSHSFFLWDNINALFFSYHSSHIWWVWTTGPLFQEVKPFTFLCSSPYTSNKGRNIQEERKCLGNDETLTMMSHDFILLFSSRSPILSHLSSWSDNGRKFCLSVNYVPKDKEEEMKTRLERNNFRLDRQFWEGKSLRRFFKGEFPSPLVFEGLTGISWSLLFPLFMCQLCYVFFTHHFSHS